MNHSEEDELALAATQRKNVKKVTNVERRTFLKVCGGALLLSASGLLTGCGGGNGSRPKDAGASNGGTISGLTLYSNPTDPLLLSSTRTDGKAFSYYGTRDARGLPTSLDHILLTRDGSTDVVRYDLDAQGRPVRIFAPNGTSFVLEWVGPKKANLIVTAPDGNVQINTEVDFNSSAAATSRSKTFTVPRLLQSPLESLSRPDNLAPRGNRAATSRAVKLSQSSSLTQGTSKLTQSANPVTVNVLRCGQPATGFLDVRVLVSDGSGKFLGTFPASRISDGIYRTSLPSNLAPVPDKSEVCEPLGVLLDIACAFTESLGPLAGTVICGAVTSAVAAVTGGISALASGLIFAGCESAVVGFEVYCSIGNASAGPGAPSLGGELCDLVEDYVNNARKSDSQTYKLQAEVIALPTNVRSSVGTAPASGAFSPLRIELGSTPQILTLTLAPSSPAEGEDYLATARIGCLPIGSVVVLSIIGTDSYSDSTAPITISKAQIEETFQLSVPGAQRSVRDTVTVDVQLPNGQKLRRVAGLVFV